MLKKPEVYMWPGILANVLDCPLFGIHLRSDTANAGAIQNFPFLIELTRRRASWQCDYR